MSHFMKLGADSGTIALRDQGQGRGKMREQTVMNAQRLGELEEMGVVALGWAEGLSSLMSLMAGA